MKNFIFLSSCLLFSFNLFSQDLIISGIFDGPLGGGTPKGVELYATADIADLSAYGLGSANNGGGTDGQEFTFPNDTASAGDYIYVVSSGNDDEFLSYYGFASNYTTGSMGINGDDAVELFYNSSVIDTYGEIDVDGNGDPWEYMDGWAYRVNNTGPNASWVQNNWTYSGANAVDGCTTNNGCSSVMPLKTFNKLSVSSGTTTISADASYDVVEVTGGTLAINKDASLTVKISFSNSGGVVNLNSDSNEFASLIVQGTSSGNIVYKRWVTDEGSNEWDLIGSPVAGQTISSFVSANSSLADESNQYAIGVFSNDGSTDTAAAMYSNYTTNGAGSTTSVNDAGNFNLGQGYAMATDEANTPGTTLDFTGTVRTTDLTGVAIDDNSSNATNFGKWNLVANPFPSYLNANDDAHGSNNFLTVNASNLHASFVAVYGYDGDGTFTAYNHSSPGSAVYIAPGQGFFVASDDSGGNTIQFTEAMQTVSGADDFNAENSDVMNDSYDVSLRLYHDNQMIDETKLFFEENLGLGLDIGYDAGSFDQSGPLMTRLVEDDQGYGMAINAMGLEAMDNAVIPLVINQSAGQEFRLNLHTATIPDPNVYLEDVEEGTFTNLYEGDFVYTPTSDLSGVGRFFIHMSADTMSNGEVSTSLLNAYKEAGANYITIEGLATQSNEISVRLFNIIGREVLSTSLNNNMSTQTVSTIGLSAGVYVIELESGTERLTKKLLIQ